MSLRSFPSRSALVRPSTCLFAGRIIRHRNASFKVGGTASPPRLPEEEQKIFEELQKRSTGAFSQPVQDSKEATEQASAKELDQPDSIPIVKVNATGKGDELHPHMRRGAPPEFEGDVNPKTGEVGGPKNEPLRWGASGEYSYNGRTTDF